MSDLLQKEIRKYHIMSYTQVRGCGSHGRRCLWDICGKTSLRWVLEAVTGSRYIDKVVVTTEDEEIAKEAEKVGATVVVRPFYTSADFPRDFERGTFGRIKPRSLIHTKPEVYTNPKSYTLYYLEKTGYVPDLILTADANRPMITPELVDRVIEAFFQDREATAATTFYPILPYIYVLNPKVNRIVPLFTTKFDRQEALPLYGNGPLTLEGLPSYSSSQGLKVAPVFITREEGLDMHDEEDLFLARVYMKRRLEKAKEA